MEHSTNTLNSIYAKGLTLRGIADTSIAKAIASKSVADKRAANKAVNLADAHDACVEDADLFAELNGKLIAIGKEEISFKQMMNISKFISETESKLQPVFKCNRVHSKEFTKQVKEKTLFYANNILGITNNV